MNGGVNADLWALADELLHADADYRDRWALLCAAKPRIPASPARVVETAALPPLSTEADAWLTALHLLGDGATTEELLPASGLDEKAARKAVEEILPRELARLDGECWSVAERDGRRYRAPALDEPALSAFAARAAEALLASRGAQAPSRSLSMLWSRAGNPVRAAEFAIRDAQRELRRGDPSIAADRFAFALRHIERRDSRRRVLRMHQATALWRARRYADCVRALGAALVLASSVAERAEVLCRQSLALTRAGRPARAREAAEQAMTLARRSRVDETRIMAACAQARALIRLGWLDQAQRLLGDALDQGGKRPVSPELAAAVRRILAVVRWKQGDTDVDGLLQEAVAALSESDAREEIARAEALRVLAAAADGRRDDAEARLAEADDGSAALAPTWVLVRHLLAGIFAGQGHLDHALNQAVDARRAAASSGSGALRALTACGLAELQLRAGQAAAAIDRLRELLANVPEGTEAYTGIARLLLAQALCEVEPEQEALRRDLTADGLATLRAAQEAEALLYGLTVELERCAMPGNNDPFESVAHELERLAALLGGGWTAALRVRAMLAQATRQLHRGDLDQALESASQARLEAEQARLTWEQIAAHSLRAQAAVRLGRRADADRAIGRAQDLVDNACSLIEDAGVRRSILERSAIKELRRPRTFAGRVRDPRLNALFEMIRALNSETDPQQLLESILEMALRTVGAERGMILLREPESGELRISAATHLEPETERDALEYSRGIVDQAAGGTSLLAVDAQEDGRFRDLRSVSLFGIRSMMCVPLRAHGTLIGTVYLDSRQGRTPFSQQDLQFLEAFADHAAVALQNANRLDALTRENQQLAHQAEERTHFAGMVGKSAEIQRVFALMDTLAPSSLPVLIEGESGTGKELVARALHGLGPRRRRVFLSENCAALPDSLLERELFGHEKGAFSGAERSMPGLFENAHEGTLFLDEIGETSLAMQAKLLRVLNENEVRRLGGTGTLKVDVRVLAATNRNLEQEVRAGRFRQDLLFRLKVLVVKLPPLRERHGDVALLVQHFVRRVAVEAGRNIPEIEPELLQAMEQYGWPGNIRQLHNVIQRLFVLGDGLHLSLDTVKADPELRTMLGGERSAAPVSLLNSEREQIQRALVASGGNRLRAAEMLGISKATIYRKIQRYGLS